MPRSHILWVDDEIDVLRSLIVVLERAGYSVTPVTNGDDAIAAVGRGGIDLMLLDEMMTGIDGVETLRAVREIDARLPVVMVTKVEEEELMNRAYEARVDDFLIKPVRPSQVLAVVKKILESERIVGEGMRRNYALEMAQVMQQISSQPSPRGWLEVSSWIFRRQMELERLDDRALLDAHADLRRDANREFFRSIGRSYPQWLDEDEVLLPHRVLDRLLLPSLDRGEKVLFVVLDCLRADQWLVMEPRVRELFALEPAFGLSLVPTATPFSRNALFAGALPVAIRAQRPDLWEDDFFSEASMNAHEEELLRWALDERRRGRFTLHYERVDGGGPAQGLAQRLAAANDIDLYAVVYGFVDMLVHKRTVSDVIREITATEGAYRALTAAWFAHSPLDLLFRTAAAVGRTVVVVSDHGSIPVHRPARVVGDRATTTAVRYKVGRNIRADRRHAIDIRDPQRWGLPAAALSTNYLVAGEDFFFVYPNQQRQYERRLAGTFQHGGLSLEEMVVPMMLMRPK
jgi:CheY-like chemotaxis protein